MSNRPIPYAMAVGSWLPYSETFIYDQVQRRHDFKPVILAREWNSAKIHFPYDSVTALSAPERLLYFSYRFAPRFGKAIRQNKAELIHAHFGTNGALIAPTAEKLGVPLVVTFHGIDVGILLGKQIPLRYRFYQKTYRNMFKTANILLPVSQHLADSLVQLGANPEKIRVHHLGVDVNAFKPFERPDRPARFLMVGRQIEKKGFEYGIRAFARIAEKFKESSLTLIGNGPLQTSLQALAAELGIAKRVIFKGVVTAEFMPKVFEDHDVLLAPCVIARNNDRDGSLTVLKEAAASAMPSIGTSCCGAPEITSYLVEQHEVNSLAEAMETLAKDHKLRIDMGNIAREKTVKEYNSATQNTRLETIFKNLI